VLVVVGITVWNRIAAPSNRCRRRCRRSLSNSDLRGPRRQRHSHGAGAVAAAAAVERSTISALDSVRIRRLVDLLATSDARDGLARAYEQGAAQARARLAADSVPAPVVILRAALVGYRIDRFTPSAATVAVWRVGIVGSGATVPPQQSWRTETVSLVWERGAWKVASFASAPGPTPPPMQVRPARPRAGRGAGIRPGPGHSGRAGEWRAPASMLRWGGSAGHRACDRRWVESR
jgi:hypothetical protein